MNQAANAPLRFFKYRSLASAIEMQRVRQIVVDRTIYFASPKQLNEMGDPDEGEVRLDFDAPLRLKQSKAKERIRKENPGISLAALKPQVDARLLHLESEGVKQFQQWLKNGVGVFSACDSAENDEMWNLYADSHQGVCLWLRLPVESPTLAELNFIGEFQRVRYAEALPKHRFYSSTKDERAKAFILTKQNRWKHEQEWRIVRQDQASCSLPFPSFLLGGIILGADISPANRHVVMEWVQNDLSVDLIQAIRTNGGLRFKPLPRLQVL